jgi:hypothetical protein
MTLKEGLDVRVRLGLQYVYFKIELLVYWSLKLESAMNVNASDYEK